VNFRSNTLIHGAELLGRKRGIFVLAAYAIEDEHSVMNTLLRDRSLQEITEERVMMNLQLLALPDATPGYPVLRKVGPADLTDALTNGVNDFLRRGSAEYQRRLISVASRPQCRRRGGCSHIC